MARLPELGAWTVLVALVTPGVTQGQDPSQAIDLETPTCSQCSIVLDTVAHVGSIEDSVLIPDRITGVLSLAGDTVAVGVRPHGRVLIYSPRGRLVRTVGKIGQGPGEISNGRDLIRYRGDSLLIVQSGRISLFDRRGELAREQRVSLRVPSALTPGPDGSLVYGFPPVDGARRFTLFDADLTPTSAFGVVAEREFVSPCMICMARVTAWATGSAGSFWSVPKRELGLEKWSKGGELLASYDLDAPSIFTPGPRSPEGPSRLALGAAPGPTSAPDPSVVGIGEDASGMIWLTALLPAQDWRPYPTGGEASDPDAYLAWRRSNFDTFIAVLDPSAGRTLTTIRLPNIQVMPTNGLYYYARTQDQSGVVSVTVMRARITREQGGGTRIPR